MDSQSPDRQANLGDKKVLLIDRCGATREARTAVLQSRGVKVRTAENLSDARFLWQPNRYDLVMLDVRRYLPGEAMEFYEQEGCQSPRTFRVPRRTAALPLAHLAQGREGPRRSTATVGRDSEAVHGCCLRLSPRNLRLGMF